MARPITNLNELEGAARLTKYSELHELVKSFANGKLQCLALVAPPGLGKSECLRQALDGTRAAYIRGYLTPLKLFSRCFTHRNQPMVLDDTEAMFASSHIREILTALTETRTTRVMEWSTSSTLLAERGIPERFDTSSPVTVIRNTWDSSDPLLAALASRSEFVTFLPNWEEVYRFMSTWFWDQEILDYVHAHLGQLKQPDVRVVMKAWQRKKAGGEFLTWRRAIQDHLVTDIPERAARKLLADKSYKSDNQRSIKWVADGHGHRATFFRLVARLKTFVPEESVRRLTVKGVRP